MLHVERYRNRFWERWRRERTVERLPLVLPILLSQGPGPWPGPLRLSDLIAVPARLAPELANRMSGDTEVALLDLTHHGVAELCTLEGPALARLTLVALKETRDGADLCGTWAEAAEVVDELLRTDEEGYETIVGYTSKVGREGVVGKLRRQVARRHGEQAAEPFRTFEEAVLARGRAIEARETLECLLRDRFGELPAEVAARLIQASPEELRGWTRRVPGAGSLLDVFSARADSES